MKSYFLSFDLCFPTEHRATFPKVRKILAHICQIKWNLISFDDENDKNTLNKRSYTEKKHLSIYSLTIYAPLVLRGSFQVIVVVKMLLW